MKLVLVRVFGKTEIKFMKVTVMEHDEATLRQMLEYIYTNRVKDMPGLSADEVIKLLALANGKIFALTCCAMSSG